MRSLNGKVEVVAPISAPMLQIVPMPGTKSKYALRTFTLIVYSNTNSKTQLKSDLDKAKFTLILENLKLNLKRESVRTCARDGIDARAEVLDDGAGAALHSEDVGHLEDDVLRRRPAAQPPRQLHADHLRAHDAPSIGVRVRVRVDKHRKHGSQSQITGELRAQESSELGARSESMPWGT